MGFGRRDPISPHHIKPHFCSQRHEISETFQISGPFFSFILFLNTWEVLIFEGRRECHIIFQNDFFFLS